jgi:fucose permease
MAQTCLYTAAEIGFGSWIVTIVSKSAGLTLVVAAPVATAFYAGMMLGRMFSAQVLKHGWLSQSRLLYLALIIGGLTGLLIAFAPGQLLIVYPASVLVGFCFGPVYPSLMAIMSRRFADHVGTASSMAMIGSGTGSMLVPVMMGALIPVLGFNGVIAFPAIFCLLVIPPMWISQREKRKTLPLPTISHTMRDSAEMPVYQ